MRTRVAKDATEANRAVPSPHAPVATERVRAGGIRLCDVRCAATHVDPAYDEEHTADSIALVKRGVFTHQSRSSSVILRVGWLMLGNVGDHYACSHEHGEDQGDDCLVLEFSAATMEAVRSAVGETRGAKAFIAPHLPPVPRVCALMRLIEDSTRETGGDVDLTEASFAVADCILRELVAPGSSREPPRPLSKRAADRDRMRHAAQYIEEGATEELSLDAIASAVGLSPFHFLRIFKLQIGVTPHQYLIRARLVRAIALLRDTSLPITEVALEAGYADLSNFVRTFHREIGCSPREFRRGRFRCHSKILQERNR